MVAPLLQLAINRTASCSQNIYMKNTPKDKNTHKHSQELKVSDSN